MKCSRNCSGILQNRRDLSCIAASTLQSFNLPISVTGLLLDVQFDKKEDTNTE